MSFRGDNYNSLRVLEEEGQCARCDEVFPFVNIVKCKEIPRRGEYTLCLKCHQRLHPGCTEAQSVLTARHYDCSLCSAREGEIVCALCTLDDAFPDDILDGVLMCSQCSDQVHKLHKAGHKDHFYPVASRRSVAVMGRVGWHNLPDQPQASQTPQSAFSAAQANTTPHPSSQHYQSSGGVSSASQANLRHFPPRNPTPLPVRGVASGVRHIVIGGSRSGVTMTSVPRRPAAAVTSAAGSVSAGGRVGGRFYRLE